MLYVCTGICVCIYRMSFRIIMHAISIQSRWWINSRSPTDDVGNNYCPENNKEEL